MAVAFDPGPLFHLGRVTIEGEVPAAARDQLGLAPGAPAVAADVLAAQQRLLTAIREAGHPLAKVELPPVDLHPGEHLLDVTFRVTEGPYADIGAIQITGLKTVNEDYVRRRLLLRSGQRYSPTQLQAAREDLAGIGVFSVVRIEPGEHVDPDGTIPILIDVTERPLHSVDVGAAYSTDLGVNATVGWHHRNLFGNAEQLNLTAGIQLGGNAERKARLQFRHPVHQAGLPRPRSGAPGGSRRGQAEPGRLRPAGVDPEDRTRPQAVRPLDGGRRPQRRGGGHHPGRRLAPL